MCYVFVDCDLFIFKKFKKKLPNRIKQKIEKYIFFTDLKKPLDVSESFEV